MIDLTDGLTEVRNAIKRRGRVSRFANIVEIDAEALEDFADGREMLPQGDLDRLVSKLFDGRFTLRQVEVKDKKLKEWQLVSNNVKVAEVMRAPHNAVVPPTDFEYAAPPTFRIETAEEKAKRRAKLIDGATIVPSE